MATKSRRRLPPLFWLTLLLAAFFLLWELMALQGRIDLVFFSSPSRIWCEFLSMLETGILRRHLLITLQEAGLGLFYGSVFGSAAGILLGISKRVSPVVMPLMVGLNSVPKLALAPLIILWFGIGLGSKVLIAGLMVFFVFTFNMYAGYHSVDASLIQTVRLLGGRRRQLIRLVIWPSCLPWFLASLRTGMGLALSGAIVGEFIGSSRGFGWLISDASGRYDLTRVLCCVFVIIVIMMVLDALVRALERTLLKWRPEA
ncbi:MAG: binding-protein-dependent transport system inner rane component [Firmicutes bacterium]|nr:binding-protein-dependent transport system inner rane component [Bacillota bacterium]